MLALQNIGKRYGHGRWILSGVTFSIEPGDHVYVAGPNGSGKSTLLRLIAGVSRPSRGRITGRPAIVGYVPDRFPADGAMSSLAYLTHVGRIRGLATGVARLRAGHWLERLELAGGVRTPIRALSKGNAQKVALSQALMVRPELLVLDEPWSGLDAAAHRVFEEILGEVDTVIFTDHRASTARRNATRSLTLGDGLPAPSVAHIVVTNRYGTARPVPPHVGQTKTAHLKVPGDECDEVLHRLLSNNWSIEEVRRS